jgi:hypothetical protein
MAAIEDHLDESQRDNLRSERNKHAHSHARSDSRDSSAKPDSDKKPDNNKQSAHSNPETSKKPEQGTSKAPQGNNSGVIVEEVEEYTFANGITLTVEQEAIADRVSNKYVRHLRKLHREIRSIHDQLIALESDKLVELEKILTKEQITQLREERQAPTGDQRVTSAIGKNAEKD